MAEIEFEKVSKSFGEGEPAVDELDLEIKDGEFMVLVGPSGCGKSTALRMVAGLEAITGGEVKIGGRVVNEVPPKDRDIAMVFQNYALYPHMTVYDNMAFALKLAKVDKSEMDRRVKEAASVLGLDEFLERKPKALSGGQRQRVAMGRAIVREPQAFLMDEPLSNLDAKLRVQMRSEIGRIQDDLGVTTIYVTHDQVEAMTMGDRVAVMRKGKLQQVGTPTELFLTPLNLFTAGFIGSPAMNFLTSPLHKDNGSYAIDIGGQSIKIAEDAAREKTELAKYDGKEIIVGIRPQDFQDASLTDKDVTGCSLKSKIDLVEVLGTETLVHFNVDAPMPATEEMRELAAESGQEDAIERQEENSFVAQLDPKTQVKRGDEVDLFVDTSQLHFFDQETSQGIYGDGTR